jgi:SNF2 family DNA or RNA helicase
MHILHGTWIPESIEHFQQRGGFYLWVETTTRKRFRKPSDRHPRQLTAADLMELLTQDLGIKLKTPEKVEKLAEPRYFLLPTVDSEPLPSLELSRYLEQELPDEFDLNYWQADCYRVGKQYARRDSDQVKDVVSVLNDLHFLAMHNLAEVQFGADLQFWFYFTQSLKRLIYNDQYIPSLVYREVEPPPKQQSSRKKRSTSKSSSKLSSSSSTSKSSSSTRSRRSSSSSSRSSSTRSKQSKRSQPARKKTGAVTQTIDTQAIDLDQYKNAEIYAGWSFIGDDYKQLIRESVSYMPIACAAGFETPQDAPSFYDRETLLRHFSDCLLMDLMRQLHVTQAMQKTIDGTLVSNCLFPHETSYYSQHQPLTVEQYQQWQLWRDRIERTQSDMPFNLYFHLIDPIKADDSWHLLFEVAPKNDPSLRVVLQDFWRMRSSERDAVVQSLGGDFEEHLLMNLGYAARIYPNLWPGLETDQPVGISLSLDAAFEFLQESAWVLENAGYKVVVPAWWTPQGRRRAKVKLKAKSKSLSSGEDKAKTYFSFENLVEYQYDLAIGDEKVSENEWNQLVTTKTPLVKFRGQWMQLDQDKMRQMLEFWKNQQAEQPEMSLLDFMKLTASNEEDTEVECDRSSALSDMLTKLGDKTQLKLVKDPKKFQGKLREYQQRGVSWLAYLEQLGLNGCLADDMGLGKTVQVIARLLHERDAAKAAKVKLAPTLLIAPTSVVGNWYHELHKFAPDLNAVVHHGPERSQDTKTFKKDCRSVDLVITSFAIARRDAKLFNSIEWHRIVLDEAQNIKNPKAALTKAILKFPAHHRLALTGTPIENRLLDLWSIFNFLNPGYLGTQTQFRRNFEVPIQKDNDPKASVTLKKLVEPFILRRVKTDAAIIKDLPDKVEQKLFCNLTKEQASLYQAIVKDAEEQLKELEGIQRKGVMLGTLTKLKQVCNHPAQFLQDQSDFTAERSHKLTRLSEMVQEVMEEGESLLIFTQFRELGDALEKYLRHQCHYNTYYLHGGTTRKKREKMIEEFQDPETEPSIFILSLKAGGVGITLTKANHVFHFDRWWNPSVEDQATDRAFRIGQKKNVFVHKFVAIGTLEERIDEMIEDKKKLAGSIVGSDESWLTELDNNAFRKLIALNQSAILE